MIEAQRLAPVRGTATLPYVPNMAALLGDVVS
jgi:hypothetical protein